MEIQLYLPIKAISLNNATAVLQNGRRVSSKKYNFFRKDVRVILEDQLPKLHKFAQWYEIDKHAIEATYYFGLTDLFTKAGRINKKSLDCSNIVKCLEDIVFAQLNKYNSGIDDGLVVDLPVRKYEAEIDEIWVQYKIMELYEVRGWKPHFGAKNYTDTALNYGSSIYDINTL